MPWKFHSKEPIYIQIMDEIKLRIAKGQLKPGDKVPPVRDLALKAGVNPNTMQKALSELERCGVLYSQRTSGRFVADQNQEDDAVREEIARKNNEEYVRKMRGIAFDDDKIVASLTKYLQGEGKYE